MCVLFVEAKEHDYAETKFLANRYSRVVKNLAVTVSDRLRNTEKTREEVPNLEENTTFRSAEIPQYIYIVIKNMVEELITIKVISPLENN